MIDKQHLKSQNLEYGLCKFKISKGKEIKCYTKKQINSLYPEKNHKFVGEYKNEKLKDKGDCIGDISVGNISLYLNKYKQNNRLLYAEKGYIQCDNNSFVVLLEKVLLKRLLIIFLIISLIGGIYYTFHTNNPINNSVRDLLDLDPNATDWNENDIPPQTPAPTTKLKGFSSMTIPKDTTNVDVSLGNPDENNCYFMISVILEDNTKLFESELIPPGKGLHNINLSKPLPQGEYKAILRYRTFNIKTQQEMNGADLNIKIIVK